MKKPSNCPSFADAIFGMKDMADNYEFLSKSEQSPQIQTAKVPGLSKFVQPKKNHILKTPCNKVVVKHEEPIRKKLLKAGDIQGKFTGSAFKVGAGKQFQQGLTQERENVVKAGSHVFEITSRDTPSQWEYHGLWDGVPISELIPQAKINFAFQAVNVKQGGLGNCYLISAIASLAHLPAILMERIPNYEAYTANSKQYQVNMFESGKYLQIPVDNLFPKIFVKPVNNDVSLLLLEKAYAQMYGNYETLNFGHSCDSLRDLTGAPTAYIDLNRSKQECFKRIREAFKQKHALIIASKAKVIQKCLSPKHSYNVLDFRVSDNQENIFLKLRDPRGNNYNNFPNQLPISEEESSNGIFWVSYSQLASNFEVLTVGKVHFGYNYFYKTFSRKQTVENQAALLMTLKAKATAYISCHQKNKKFFDCYFNYPMVRILLVKVQVGKHTMPQIVSVLGSQFKCKQVITLDVCEGNLESQQLEPGSYVILCTIGLSGYKVKTPQELLTISVYTEASPHEISFSSLKGKLNPEPYLRHYIRNHQQQFKSSVTDLGGQTLCRLYGPLYGYMCIYYENRSNKTVSEQLTYCAQNIRTKDSKVELGPGEQKLLMHQIGEQNQCSHKFSFKNKTLYKS